ncbi:MAG: hypothetical protein WDO73_24745 [Ignavibacteriota bacterium]
MRAGNQAVAMQFSPAGDALWVLYRDPAALIELPLDTLHPGRRVRLPAPPDAFDLVMHHDRKVPIAAIVTRANRTIELASLANPGRSNAPLPRR